MGGGTGGGGGGGGAPTAIYGLDAAAAGVLFSDSGGTVPATNGQRVLFMANKTGVTQDAMVVTNGIIGNPTNGPKMVTGSINGKTVINFDSSSSGVATGLLSNMSPSGTNNPLTAFAHTHPWSIGIVVNLATVSTQQWLFTCNQGGGGSSFVGWNLNWNPSSGSVGHFNLVLESSPNGYIFRTNSSNIDSSLGSWWHTLATYDGSATAAGISMYTNGTLDNGSPVTNGTWPDSGIIPSSPGAPPAIGGRWGGFATLSCLMGEVMIYDHVLTAGERTAEFARIVAKYGLPG
jgi:hypothetical protein